jgi:putative dimethyl sulfoxide reductase chaperone
MTLDLSPRERQQALVDAAGRATVYALLAHGMATPTADRWQVVRSSLLPATSSLELGSPLDGRLQALVSSVPASVEHLRSAHLALFPPVAHQDAPGYETAYRGEDLFRQMDMLADIAGFYRAHGFRAGSAERERPDHIVVELEFCSVLARKQLHALAELGAIEVEVCRDSTRSFVAEHLACWAPAFGRRAAVVAAHPWYAALGYFLADWVEADAAALGVSPVETAEEPLPQEPPDDGSCGPCPVGL